MHPKKSGYGWGLFRARAHSPAGRSSSWQEAFPPALSANCPPASLVKIGEKWGYIDKTGKLVIKPQFSETYSFYDGLAAVTIGEKWGYIDKTGKVVLLPQFSQAYSFFEGIAAVKIGEKSGYVDKTGKQAIRLQFDGDFIAGGNFIYSSEREPGSFSEGLTAVAIKDNDATIGLGYINKRGQLVIKTEFHEIDNFSFGLAAGETSNGICGVRFNYCAYGYIDKTGKMVIEPKFFSSK